MVTLTLATVRTNAYTELYNLLQTGSFAITTSNIHPSYNNNQTIKENYPQVIVNEPLTSFERKTMGGSGTSTTKLYNVPIRIKIDIYHNSAANAKTVADEVCNSIITGRETLRQKCLYNIDFDSDDINVVEYAQHKSIHQYSLNLSATFMVTG